MEGSIIAAKQIMLAANFSVRAINIAETTAAHAMSCKLTSMYGLPHGHAIAACLPCVWEYMAKCLYRCIDVRGMEYVWQTFQNISRAMGGNNSREAISRFYGMLQTLEIKNPTLRYVGDIDVFTASVNPAHLENDPIRLDKAAIRSMYESIMREM